MLSLETNSSRILDSRINNLKVQSALKEMKTAVNSPAPGSSAVIQSVIPDRNELSALSSQGVTSVFILISGSTSLIPVGITLSPTSNTAFKLPRKPDEIKLFEESWEKLEAPITGSYRKSTEVHSTPSLDRLDALKLALSADKFALLARIRAFRKKAGKLTFTTNELLERVREESA